MYSDYSFVTQNELKSFPFYYFICFVFIVFICSSFDSFLVLLRIFLVVKILLRGECFFKPSALRGYLKFAWTAMSPCTSNCVREWCRISISVFFVKRSNLSWRWQFGPKFGNCFWSSVNLCQDRFIHLSLMLGSRMFSWYSLQHFLWLFVSV